MKKSYIIEIIIFIILITILSLLGLKAFKHTFDIGTTYHVAFHDIDSIVVGSPVKILGVDIGHVTKVKSAYDQINVDFVVTNHKIKLPDGTVASIEFSGIAGSRAIELTPPNKISDEKGIIIKEPIRIGDAFGIMSKFIRATMVSIGGLYEFAKDKKREDVDRMTQNFLTTTHKTDDKIINVTNTIEKNGAVLHTGLTNTTAGMTRVTNDIETLNISKNFNIARYTVNLSRRSLIKMHKRIKVFNDNAEKYSDIAISISDKSDKAKKYISEISDVCEAMAKVNNAVDVLNQHLTQENLDKAYDAFENLRLFSENLNNSI
ncbi:MAG: MCE family protein [Candidatus Gastranaerophilales bacterium]|nr:MCE family protein [Candidatus Gastranaerophilales bacterium]